MSYCALLSQPLALLLLLLAFAALAIWLILRLRHEEERSTQEATQGQQQFRQWRNRMAEEVMAQRLKELGWPKAATRMRAEEVAHQLCNRLADRLWNRPNVD